MKRYWLKDIPETSIYGLPMTCLTVTYNNTTYTTSLRKKLNGQYSLLCVEYDDTIYKFLSKQQALYFTVVLENKHLPSAKDIAVIEKSTEVNSHWLSRLPAHTKAYSYRLKLIKYIREVLEEIEKKTDIDYSYL